MSVSHAAYVRHCVAVNEANRRPVVVFWGESCVLVALSSLHVLVVDFCAAAQFYMCVWWMSALLLSSVPCSCTVS